MAKKIMKKFKLTLILLLVATVLFAQKSPRKQATAEIGNVTIDVDYGSPNVKERVIWGELVPYGKVWRAGANENTTFSFDEEVTIGDTTIEAGKYGFFIIPNENDDWVIILNSKNDAWGAFSYNETEDVLRITISPEFVDENQEELEYTIGNEGIQFSWEKIKIVIPIQ